MNLNNQCVLGMKRRCFASAPASRVEREAHKTAALLLEASNATNVSLAAALRPSLRRVTPHYYDCNIFTTTVIQPYGTHHTCLHHSNSTPLSCSTSTIPLPMSCLKCATATLRAPRTRPPRSAASRVVDAAHGVAVAVVKTPSTANPHPPARHTRPAAHALAVGGLPQNQLSRS